MHELRAIAAFISRSQSVALVGRPGSGKTALIFQLMRSASWPSLGLDTGNLFVYVNCDTLAEGTHSRIFGRMAMEIGAALAGQGLPEEPALVAAIAQPSRIAFETALRRLNQRRLRVVLILDDFECLSANPLLDVAFLNALRSIAARLEVVFVTASTRPLIELTYAGRAQEIVSSPFFNIFATILLRPEDEAEHG
jgi:Cdc6-like AAA superfamily ATPase